MYFVSDDGRTMLRCDVALGHYPRCRRCGFKTLVTVDLVCRRCTVSPPVPAWQSLKGWTVVAMHGARRRIGEGPWAFELTAPGESTPCSYDDGYDTYDDALRVGKMLVLRGLARTPEPEPSPRRRSLRPRRGMRRTR